MAAQTKMDRIKTKLSMIGRLNLLLKASKKPTDANSSSGSNGASKATAAAVEIKDEWRESFENLLADPEGLQAFTDFLKKEYSEENIVFWQECRTYAQISDDAHRRRQATHIYETHLGENASEPVNVDSAARKMVHERLDNPTPDTFSMAQIQTHLIFIKIFNLMRTDSYRRFLKSASSSERKQSITTRSPAVVRKVSSLSTTPELSPRRKVMAAKGRSVEDKDARGKQKSLTLPAKVTPPGASDQSLPPDLQAYVNGATKCSRESRRGSLRTPPLDSAPECTYMDTVSVQGPGPCARADLSEGTAVQLNKIVSEIDDLCQNSQQLNTEIKASLQDSLDRLRETGSQCADS